MPDLRPFVKRRKPGWATAAFKNRADPIVIPAGEWRPVFRWLPGDVDLGPSALFVEGYARPPGRRPTDLQVRYVRLEDPDDPTDDDFTKRTGLVVTPGVIGFYATGGEDLQAHDLPLELRIFSDRRLTLHGLILKVGRFAS